MKILLLNQDWFAKELRALGHEVVVCGMADHMEVRIQATAYHIDNLIKEFLGGFEPEVIVWLDNSAPVMVIGLENCKIPIIFYSVDTQHHYELHSCLAPAFDHILIAQRDYIPYFHDTGTPTEWFPLWAPRFIEASCEKRFGLTFVGNLNAKLNPDRVAFFERFKKLAPIHIQQGNYWEIFPYAEIIVNQTVKGDLNFRVFEAMMSGALLLTENSSNGLLDLFNDGEHLVTYERGDAAAAAALSNELLSDQPRMRRIAEAGRAEILAKHTSHHRALMLEKIIRRVKKRPLIPKRFFSMMINHNTVSTATESDALGLSVKAVIAAVSSAQSALDEGAEPDEIESAHLIRSCIRYDRLVGTGGGAAILRSYAEMFPDNYLLNLAEVRSRLNQGKHSDAKALASRLSPEPHTTVFELAENTISLLME